MLVDDLKNLTPRQDDLFWIGYDVRYSLAEAEGATDAALFEQVRSLLDDFRVYDAGPLTATLYEQWKARGFRFVSDCFAPMPPHPATAIELVAPANREHRGLVLLESSPVTEVPAVRRYFTAEATRLRAEPKDRHVKMVDIDDLSEEQAEIITLDDAAWMINASVAFRTGPGHYFFMDSLVGYFCDHQGRLLTSLMSNRTFDLSFGGEFKKEEMYLGLMSTASAFMNYAGMVLNLLGCKNIGSQKRPIADALQRARARRGKQSLTECHVLTVTVPGARHAQTSAATVIGGAGEPQELQTIPGSYRDYREGEGLFGKYRGIFIFRRTRAAHLMPANTSTTTNCGLEGWPIMASKTRPQRMPRPWASRPRRGFQINPGSVLVASLIVLGLIVGTGGVLAILEVLWQAIVALIVFLMKGGQ